MIALPETVALPLKLGEDGAIRVSGTRITLDTLISFYQQSETPEDLHEGFPTVPLADIYAVIAYYLAHQVEVDTYLKRRSKEASRHVVAANPENVERVQQQTQRQRPLSAPARQG